MPHAEPVETSPAEPPIPDPSPEARDSIIPIPLGVRSLVLTGIFALLLLHTLHLARAVVVPVVVALLANLALTPVVRRLRRLGIPALVAAALIVLVLVGVSITALAVSSESAVEWLSRLPESAEQIERKLRPLKKPIEHVTQATESVEEATRMETTPSREVAIRESEGWITLLLTQAQEVVVALVLVSILVFFLLASGETFLRKVVELLPNLTDKKRVVQAVRQTETEISLYLFTISVINLTLGTVVALAMAGLGMPNPILWGVMTAVLNFVPYLGALATFVVLAAVALLSFDDLVRAALVPAVFVLLTAAEGLVITPYLVGRRLMLSPVTILLGLLLWSWVWGIPGALLAVPILVATKIVCEHVERLRPIAHVVGR